MRFVRILSVPLLLFAIGCSQEANVEPSKKTSKGDNPWPANWSKLLGQQVTLKGSAANAKLGALLMSDDEASIWIDGLDAWPEGYYEGGDRGKRVRVTGTVIVKNDLPVFIRKPGDPPRSGMQAPEGTDLHEASKRYLLKDARWEIVE